MVGIVTCRGRSEYGHHGGLERSEDGLEIPARGWRHVVAGGEQTNQSRQREGVSWSEPGSYIKKRGYTTDSDIILLNNPHSA